jgi:hypothetical protein
MGRGDGGAGSPGGMFPEAAVAGLGFLVAHDGTRLIGWQRPAQA